MASARLFTTPTRVFVIVVVTVAHTTTSYTPVYVAALAREACVYTTTTTAAAAAAYLVVSPRDTHAVYDAGARVYLLTIQKRRIIIPTRGNERRALSCSCRRSLRCPFQTRERTCARAGQDGGGGGGRRPEERHAAVKCDNIKEKRNQSRADLPRRRSRARVRRLRCYRRRQCSVRSRLRFFDYPSRNNPRTACSVCAFLRGDVDVVTTIEVSAVDHRRYRYTDA